MKKPLQFKTVNIDPDLHRRLSIVAATKGTVLRDEVNRSVSNHLAKEENKLARVK